MGYKTLCEQIKSVCAWSTLKFHSQGLLQQQIDLDIWNLHAFLSQVTEFHNSRARRS